MDVLCSYLLVFPSTAGFWSGVGLRLVRKCLMHMKVVCDLFEEGIDSCDNLTLVDLVAPMGDTSLIQACGRLCTWLLLVVSTRLQKECCELHYSSGKRGSKMRGEWLHENYGMTLTFGRAHDP